MVFIRLIMGFNFCVNVRYRYRRVTGVERYAGEVVKRLGDKIRSVSPCYPVSGILGHIWEQFYLPAKVRKGEILWSPANTGPLSIRNQVVSVYDLSPIEHPEWFRREFAAWYRLLLPRLLKISLKVITISNFSKKRIAGSMQIPEDKIAVAPGGVDRDTYHPIESSEVEFILSRYSLRRPFILAMEPQNIRKNAHTLLKAWEAILYKYPDLSLIFVGGSHGGLKRTRPESIDQSITLLDPVSDHELAALMSGAEIFVYPSLYEGFGLPVLEAMACGTPVVASNAGGLLEAVGDEGILIDPLDVDRLVCVIERLLSEPDFREKEIIRGLKRAEQYSWDITARIIEQTLSTISST